MARLNSPPRLTSRWQHKLDDHVIALEWSADGSLIAAASVSGPVAILDVSNGEVKHTLAGHGFGTTDVAWQPGGKRLATAGQDGKVRLWDSSNGREVATLAGGSAWVEHLAWSPKGDYLASGAGKKLRLWN